MVYITFISSWNFTNCNKELTLLTPFNSGKWNNLEITEDLSKSEIIIILDTYNHKLNFENKKIICFTREPNNNNLNWNNINGIKNTYKNHYHVFTNLSFLNKNFDYFKNLELPRKTKLISSVVSGIKNNNLSYIKRYNFIIKFCKKYPELCDVYGHSWKNELGKSYKGELGKSNINKNKNNTSKINGLIDYKYSICIENCSIDNYFTEKFTDSILCWTIPLYWGCKNIDKYFPEGSYYKIDIDNENIYEKINEIIKKPITEDNIKALNEARNLILYKYNIMNAIEELI
tara:strand:- start:7931 stop:8794 length:864 start_codon:yes stop_codon:yes gene_type:complete